MLAPEAPYPLHGGGAYRTASLLHYFAGFADIDLVLISESGPALLPPGLVRKQSVIGLPAHGNGTLERYFRNARRALAGVPPLVDRLSGFGPAILQAIGAGPELVGAAVERQPAKVGKVMAATGIPIISEEAMRADPPEWLLVSPWFFRAVFVEREAEYLKNGGRMAFPLPRFEVVGA